MSKYYEEMYALGKDKLKFKYSGILNRKLHELWDGSLNKPENAWLASHIPTDVPIPIRLNRTVNLNCLFPSLVYGQKDSRDYFDYTDPMSSSFIHIDGGPIVGWVTQIKFQEDNSVSLDIETFHNMFDNFIEPIYLSMTSLGTENYEIRKVMHIKQIFDFYPSDRNTKKDHLLTAVNINDSLLSIDDYVKLIEEYKLHYCSIDNCLLYFGMNCSYGPQIKLEGEE